MRRIGAMAVVLGLALAGGACSDDDGGDEDSSPTTEASGGSESGDSGSGGSEEPEETTAPDDGGEETTAPEGGGGEFVEQGNAICEEAFGAVDQVEEPEGPEQAAAAFTEVKGHFERAAEELAALEPPEEDAAAYDEALAGLDELIALLDEVIGAAESGDQAALEAALAEGEPVQDRVNEQFAAVGLDVCAEE